MVSVIMLRNKTTFYAIFSLSKLLAKILDQLECTIQNLPLCTNIALVPQSGIACSVI